MALLVSNINVVLVVVIIPFLLIWLFTLIRIRFGNSVSALSDILVFLSTTDFVIVLSPLRPWMSLVHPLFKNSLAAWFFAFGVLAAIFFVLSLRVEQKLLRLSMQRALPMLTGFLPPDIARQGFPYLGVVGCWASIVLIIALNVLPFTLEEVIKWSS